MKEYVTYTYVFIQNFVVGKCSVNDKDLETNAIENV
jgi:hypothetical protein